MSGLATYISDYSNIRRVGILTFNNMLNALHITSVQLHAQTQCLKLTPIETN